MLENEKPDLVSIASPSAFHYSQTMDSIKAGAHVLCEKPVAPSLEQIDEMIEAADQQDVKLMIGLMKRFHNGLTKVKDIIDNGELGHPVYIWAHHTFSMNPSLMAMRKLPPSLEKTVKAAGGATGPGLIHYIDAFRWMMGDVTTVSGEIDNMFPKSSYMENHFSADLRFANGVHGNIVLGIGPARNFEQVESGGIYFTGGSVLFDVADYRCPTAANEVLQQDAKTGAWTQIPLKADHKELSHWQYKREIDYFVQCVKENVEPIPSGLDGRKAHEIIYATYLSWYSGKKVTLPLQKTPPLVDIFRKLRNEALVRERTPTS
jgi:predicted dehydrogenase